GSHVPFVGAHLRGHRLGQQVLQRDHVRDVGVQCVLCCGAHHVPRGMRYILTTSRTRRGTHEKLETGNGKQQPSSSSVSSFQFQVSGFKFPVSSFRFPVSSFSFLFSRTATTSTHFRPPPACCPRGRPPPARCQALRWLRESAAGTSSRRR